MGTVVDSFQGSALLCSAGQMWKTTIPVAPVSLVFGSVSVDVGKAVQEQTTLKSMGVCA